MPKAALAAALLWIAAQEKKEGPPPAPRVLFFAPLAAKPGETVKIVARGLSLDQATEVAFADPAVKGEFKLKSKGKAALPTNAEAAVVGDTQVEFELKLAAETPAGRAKVVVTTPAGKTEGHPLCIVPADRLVPEKEQNGGFAAAQPLEDGTWIQGAIGGAKDVDVFRIEGKAGAKWAFEVTAHRLGSVLDPSLSLYAESGRLVAQLDDGTETRDPLLRATLPADGRYFLSLIDAHDQGGATHPYLLHASRER